MSDKPFAIPEEIAELIDGALDAANPIAVAAVSPDARPELTFRGSVMVFGPDRLSFWLRNATGGSVQAIEANPNIALLLHAFPKAPLVQLTGRARIVTEGADRDRAYELMHPREKQADPDRKGVAAIVEVDTITSAFIRDGKPQFTRLTRDG